MASSSALNDQPNKWRDVERVVILNKMIQEIDEYTDAPSPDKWVEFFDCGGCCFPRSKFADSINTSQLQFLLSLEKELDDELCKPLEYPGDELYCHSDYLATIYKLQKRIFELEDETEGVAFVHEGCCNTNFSIPMSTNLLLLKNILQIRLDREKRKEQVKKNASLFTYGSISKPTIDTEEQEINRQKKVAQWKDELSKLMKPQLYLNLFDENSVQTYLVSLYRMIKEKDLQSKIRQCATINKDSPPAYSEL